VNFFGSHTRCCNVTAVALVGTVLATSDSMKGKFTLKGVAILDAKGERR